jgi:hypothetical protein
MTIRNLAPAGTLSLPPGGFPGDFPGRSSMPFLRSLLRSIKARAEAPPAPQYSLVMNPMGSVLRSPFRRAVLPGQLAGQRAAIRRVDAHIARGLLNEPIENKEACSRAPRRARVSRIRACRSFGGSRPARRRRLFVMASWRWLRVSPSMRVSSVRFSQPLQSVRRASTLKRPEPSPAERRMTATSLHRASDADDTLPCRTHLQK